MPLDSLPSWLSVSPRDFLLATQAGVQAGSAIAESTRRAFEQQQQFLIKQQELQNSDEERKQQQGDLATYRAAQLEARGNELGYQQKSLDQRTQNAQDKLTLAEQRAADSNNFRDLAHQVRQGQLERLTANNKMANDIAQARLELAQQRAGDSENKFTYRTRGDDLIRINPDGSAVKVKIDGEDAPAPVVKPPGWFKQATDYLGITSSPSTGSIPMSPTSSTNQLPSAKSIRYVRDKSSGMLVPASE